MANNAGTARRADNNADTQAALAELSMRLSHVTGSSGHGDQAQYTTLAEMTPRVPRDNLGLSDEYWDKMDKANLAKCDPLDRHVCAEVIVRIRAITKKALAETELITVPGMGADLPAIIVGHGWEIIRQAPRSIQRGFMSMHVQPKLDHILTNIARAWFGSPTEPDRDVVVYAICPADFNSIAPASLVFFLVNVANTRLQVRHW